MTARLALLLSLAGCTLPLEPGMTLLLDSYASNLFVMDDRIVLVTASGYEMRQTDGTWQPVDDTTAMEAEARSMAPPTEAPTLVYHADLAEVVEALRVSERLVIAQTNRCSDWDGSWLAGSSCVEFESRLTFFDRDGDTDVWGHLTTDVGEYVTHAGRYARFAHNSEGTWVLSGRTLALIADPV